MSQHPWRVPAACLRPGDYLKSDNSKILSIVQMGLKVPPGKVEVTLQRTNGNVTTHYWRKQTLIAIESRILEEAGKYNDDNIGV